MSCYSFTGLFIGFLCAVALIVIAGMVISAVALGSKRDD